MAVTLAQLAVSLRLITDLTETIDPAVSLVLTRLDGVADAVIAQQIPNAPDAIKDECKVRFVAYLYDAPTSGQGLAYANAWRNSGAAALASRWVVRRAGGQTDE